MKKAILLAAYGAGGVSGTRTLKLFESAVGQAVPNTSIRWAFTSMLMRSRLAQARKKTDSIKKALCRLGFEKFDSIAVQSLHVIPGVEYYALLEEIEAAKAAGAPQDITVGKPLLSDESDIQAAATALISCIPAQRKPEDGVIWAGHGTWHDGNISYRMLENAAQQYDKNIFLGTLSGAQGFDHAYQKIVDAGIKKVWLMPLLSVVGKHAAEDLGGTEDGAWRKELEKNGIECKPVIKGAIEYSAFTAIWVKHLLEAKG